MTKLAWLTDVHFNFLKPEKTFKFGKMVAGSGEACVITGDIAEGDSVCRLLNEFQQGFGGDVYFVLGNHDFYKSRFRDVRIDVREACKNNRRLHYLGDGATHTIGHTQLCGVDGWYDYQAGATDDRPHINMTDWALIWDFKSVYRELREYQDHEPLVSFLRYLGQESAVNAMSTLKKLDKSKPTIFATHVPPFSGATWHEGNLSNENYLPFFCNVSLGYALNDWAKDAQYLTTLCGHTHSKGNYRALENHYVFTGEADYGNPKVNAVFDLT